MQLTQNDPDPTDRLDPGMEPSRPKKGSLEHRSRSLEFAVRRAHRYTQGPPGGCRPRLRQQPSVLGIQEVDRPQNGDLTPNWPSATNLSNVYGGCGGVCMLILNIVTRLADLSDMSAQLQGNASASSHLSLL
jgi:hypothetical protein